MSNLPPFRVDWQQRFELVKTMMKDKQPPIKIRDVAEALGTRSTNTALNALWHWHELGLVKYVATGKDKGEWYLV